MRSIAMVPVLALLLAACGGPKGAKNPIPAGPHACKVGDLADCQKQCETNKNAASCVTLADMYAKGEGTPIDVPKANSAYSLGCDYGDAKACTLAGKAFLADGANHDDTRAFDAFKKGCDLKDAQSCVQEGEMLFRGVGTQEDFDTAKKLWIGACEDFNNADGCYWRGELFDMDSADQDPERAFAYYDRACYLGSMKGCAKLGNAYLLGSGVDSDADKGMELLQKACKSGDTWACGRIKELQEGGY